jgi:hypothetical protein
MGIERQMRRWQSRGRPALRTARDAHKRATASCQPFAHHEMSASPPTQSPRALLAKLQESADDVSVFEGTKLLIVESIRFSCLSARCPHSGSLSALYRSEHAIQRWLQFATGIDILRIEREHDTLFKVYMSARTCPAMNSKKHEPLVWASLSISSVSAVIGEAYMSFGCDDPEAHRVTSSSSTRAKAGQWRLYADTNNWRDFFGVWAPELATFLCAKVAVGAVLRP